MKTPTPFARAAMTALTALTAMLTAAAQAQEPVLREGQVTQQALIDALAPRAAASAADGSDEPRSRGFRPGVRVAGAAAVAAQPAPASRASILVTFVTNSAELAPSAKSALDVLAGAMKSDKLASSRFTIEGHADPRGGDALNLKLSQARADAVREYLVAAHALNGERVDAVGRGSKALMNASDPTAPENRRVTIVARPN